MKRFLGIAFLTACLNASPAPDCNAILTPYDAGACFLEAGQYQAAADKFRAYSETHPNDFRGWLMLSRAELRSKNFKAAQQDAQKAAALNANSVEAYRSLGEADLELHDNQGAYQAWLHGHKLDAEDARTDYYIGRLFFEADFWDEAAGWFRQAYHLDPHDYAVMTYLGMTAERMNFTDTAVKLYNAAIEESKKQNKPYSWAYLAFAKYLHDQGKDTEAIVLLEEAEQLCPEAHALAEEGQLLASAEPEKAEALLRRALAMDATIPEAHYRLALLLRSKGQEQQAQQELKEFQTARDAEQASKNSVQAIRRGS